MVKNMSIPNSKTSVLTMESFIKYLAHTLPNRMAYQKENRHIVETSLALLYPSHLPLNFWSYAFSTASFLINRLPTSVLNFISPWEKTNSISLPLSAL